MTPNLNRLMEMEPLAVNETVNIIVPFNQAMAENGIGIGDDDDDIDPQLMMPSVTDTQPDIVQVGIFEKKDCKMLTKVKTERDEVAVDGDSEDKSSVIVPEQDPIDSDPPIMVDENDELQMEVKLLFEKSEQMAAANPDRDEKSVLEVKSERALDVLEHENCLKIMCRICGAANVETKTVWYHDKEANENKSKTMCVMSSSAMFNVFELRWILSSLHDVNVFNESNQVFPRRVCMTCFDKYRKSVEHGTLHRRTELARNAIRSEGNSRILKLARDNPIADFWAHSSLDCSLCNNFANLSTEDKTVIRAMEFGDEDVHPVVNRWSVGGSSYSEPVNSLPPAQTPRGRGKPRGRAPSSTGRRGRPPRSSQAPSTRRPYESSYSAAANRSNGGDTNGSILHDEVGDEDDEISSARVDRQVRDFDSTPPTNGTVGSGADQSMPDMNINVGDSECQITDEERDQAEFDIPGEAKEYKAAVIGQVLRSLRQSDPEVGRILYDLFEFRLDLGKIPCSSVVNDPCLTNDCNQALETLEEVEEEDGKALIMARAIVIQLQDYGPAYLIDAGIDVSAMAGDLPSLRRTLRQLDRFGSRTVLMNIGSCRKARLAALGMVDEGEEANALSQQGLVRLSTDELSEAKRQIQTALKPISRIMRIDVVRKILLNDSRRRAMLDRVGISFDPVHSHYHCEPGLSQEAYDKFVEVVSRLIDIQWAVIIAETIFKLIEPSDSLSLEVAGISLDPSNVKTPLFYRIGSEIRRFLSRYAHDVSRSHLLAPEVVDKLDLNFAGPQLRAVDAVLKCGMERAECFVRVGRLNATSASAKKRKLSRSAGTSQTESVGSEDGGMGGVGPENGRDEASSALTELMRKQIPNFVPLPPVQTSDVSRRGKSLSQVRSEWMRQQRLRQQQHLQPHKVVGDQGSANADIDLNGNADGVDSRDTSGFQDEILYKGCVDPEGQENVYVLDTANVNGAIEVESTPAEDETTTAQPNEEAVETPKEDLGPQPNGVVASTDSTQTVPELPVVKAVKSPPLQQLSPNSPVRASRSKRSRPSSPLDGEVGTKSGDESSSPGKGESMTPTRSSRRIATDAALAHSADRSKRSRR